MRESFFTGCKVSRRNSLEYFVYDVFMRLDRCNKILIANCIKKFRCYVFEWRWRVDVKCILNYEHDGCRPFSFSRHNSSQSANDNFPCFLISLRSRVACRDGSLQKMRTFSKIVTNCEVVEINICRTIHLETSIAIQITD